MVQHSSLDHSGLTGVGVSYGSNATRVSVTSSSGSSNAVARADHRHDGIGQVVSNGSNTLSRGTLNLRMGTVTWGLDDSDGDGVLDRMTLNGGGTSGSTGNYTGVVWSSGTSMPGSPVTGQRITRTDLGLDFYYDGTQWLTTQLFKADANVVTITSTSNENHRYRAHALGLDVWIVGWNVSVDVLTTNDGSNNWTLALFKRANAGDAGTSVSTISTSALTAGTWASFTTAIGVSIDDAANLTFTIAASVKNGAPGNVLVVGGFTYRLIGT